jgi:hypothetical protein
MRCSFVFPPVRVSLLPACLLVLVLLQGASAQGQLANGTYAFRSAVRSRYLDVQWGNAAPGTPMHLWDYHGGAAQRWQVKKTAQGFYTLQSDLGGHLDVANASNAPGTPVHLWTYNGSAAQQWYFTPAGDGSYFIYSAVGTYLDVQNANSAAGTPIWMYPFNGSSAQRWYAEEQIVQSSTLGRALQQTGVRASTDNTPGSILVRLLDVDGNPIQNLNRFRYKLVNSKSEELFPERIEYPGNGMMRFGDIPPGRYTLSFFFTEGDSQGDSFSFVQTIYLSPDYHSIDVSPGKQSEMFTFQVK